MFYPVDSLKRGGRFYLCWVADSWPLRFAAITHRQLWSQDIRQLCDDLLEVMTNESGRANHRFSLRLSSQLMRGLVRLYERKATVLLGELCMINANVFKHTNKKLHPHDVQARPPRRLPHLPPAPPALPAPSAPAAGEEQMVEELLQNSGNVVSNIQDITLKEAVIPEFQLPPNDNFGEENPDQPLQSLLADRTIEQMMRDTSHAQISGLDLPVDKSTDKSHDKSRVMLEPPQMESVAELDVTLFRKSAGEAVLPTFDKDVPEIPIPAVPVSPAPIQPIPISEIRIDQPEEIPVPPEEVPAPPPEPEVTKEAEVPTEKQTGDRPQEKNVSVVDQLEELEEQPLARKRRARTSLIIDKRIKLTSDSLRARIDNPQVEMRCENFTHAIIDIRVPFDLLCSRPAHAGVRLHSRMSPLLGRLYMRNLAPARGVPYAERLTEQVQDTEMPRQRRTRPSALDNIPEVEEPQPEAAMVPPPALDTTRRGTDVTEHIMDVTAPNITAEVLNVTAEVHMPMDTLNAGEVPPQLQDIADLPTQKLETFEQVARKRTSEFEPLAKRQRSMGYVSFKENQKSMQLPEIIIDEPDKENIPPNIQEPIEPQQPTVEPQQPTIEPQQPTIEPQQPTIEPQQPIPEPQIPADIPLEQSQADAARLLQEAGLSDVQQHPEIAARQTQEKVVQESRARRGSSSSDTPLGSLDRTKVSLGDSAKTTDSQRFIRAQYGIEGTMMKIMVCVKRGGPVTVSRLVRAGPALPGHTHIIAAKCFTAILKLKQHGFIRIIKNPETLEINDITLGPRFDSL